jgi:hypothetical protein
MVNPAIKAPQHRSLRSLRLPPQRLAGGIALAVALTQLLLWARPWIAATWSAELAWWLHALELPGRLTAAAPTASGLLSLDMPRFDVVPSAQPGLAAVMHGLAVAALWWVAGWLPDAARPGAYLLRFICLVHGASVLYFSAWPGSFPHSLASHTDNGLRQMWALMLLTPWIHLCTYYLFPFAWWQRAALSTCTALFLFVLAPLQYALHTALLHHLGLIVMPLLYMLFGVMVPITCFVALYGWAMAWPTPAGAEQAR